MLCLITSPRARGGRDPVSSSCSLSSRRQCCPADRKCTEELRLGVQPWESGDVCECVCVCVYVQEERGSRKDSGDVLFLFWMGLKNESVAKVEVEHTKRTDQRTGQSFLLDEPTSLHRPCLSLSVFSVHLYWLPTTSTRDLTEGDLVCSALLSNCHVGLLHFFKLLVWKCVYAGSEINNQQIPVNSDFGR